MSHLPVKMSVDCWGLTLSFLSLDELTEKNVFATCKFVKGAANIAYQHILASHKTIDLSHLEIYRRFEERTIKKNPPSDIDILIRMRFSQLICRGSSQKVLLEEYLQKPQAQNLTGVQIFDGGIDDNSVPLLTKLPHLREVTFTGCLNVTRTGVIDLLEGASSLRRLGLCNSTGYAVSRVSKNRPLDGVISHGRNLTELDLSDGWCTCQDIQEVLKKLPNLCKIDLTGTPAAIDPNLQALLGPNLKLIGTLRPPAKPEATQKQSRACVIL